MTTISEFLTANLDRIERTAREASERGQSARDFFGKPVVLPTRYGHPDFVLAWVAGLRAVVKMHTPLELCDHEGCTPTCAVCNEGDVAAETDYYANWPCPTLRALAGIFADQPGYDEEWR